MYHKPRNQRQQQRQQLQSNPRQSHSHGRQSQHGQNVNSPLANGMVSMATSGGNHRFEPLRSLFLGDLSYFCNEQHIYVLFASHGPIVAINLCRGSNGETLYYAFVELSSEEATVKAWRELNGKEFMGRFLR
jgi:RNA recognition motif-containing protein